MFNKFKKDFSIWTITMIEKIEPIYSDKEPDKFIINDLGTTSCVGFYRKKKDAIQTLHKNCCDIRECVYDYAVLEEVREGLYGSGHTEPQWFKYDYEKDGFFEIPMPEGENPYRGYWIG